MASSLLGLGAPATKFNLSMVRKTKVNKPPRVVIHGGPKLGKSTFGSCAPNPFFIITEDGQEHIDAQGTDLLTDWTQIKDVLQALYTEQHDYKTIVLDSMDWAEKLLHKHVVAQEKNSKVTSIEHIGYGKGYKYACEHAREMLDALNALRNDKNMGIIVVCHSEAKTFNDPLSASYERWQMKLHKDLGKMVSEWADVIGFCHIRASTMTETKSDFGKTKRNIVMNNEQRVLHLSPSPAWDAGNRYGLPSEIDLSYAAFAAEMEKARL